MTRATCIRLGRCLRNSQAFTNAMYAMMYQNETSKNDALRKRNRSLIAFTDEILDYLIYFVVSWPVRTLSFSHDGEMLASGSEDLIIDIVCCKH